MVKRRSFFCELFETACNFNELKNVSTKKSKLMKVNFSLEIDTPTVG
jgi:hypothetical protein